MDWAKALRHGSRSGKVYRGYIYYIWKAQSRGERHILVASERRKRILGGHRCPQADPASTSRPAMRLQPASKRYVRPSKHVTAGLLMGEHHVASNAREG